RLPFEDREPQPGDRAEVVLVDLKTGTDRVVAQTLGWDTQLGAQAQWGVDDSQLFFNDMEPETWRPFGVRLDPLTGTRKELDGTVYMVSPDGRLAASPSFLKMGLTQLGYGVIAPPGQVAPNKGAPADDGIFVTDTESGKCRLLVSLEEIVQTATPAFDMDVYRKGDFYGFHVKWNLQGNRLMVVLRWRPHDGGKMKHDLITMRADGSDIRVAVSDTVWGKGGHHPNWCPDGETVMINVKLDGETLRLAQAHYDGSGLVPMTEAVMGSGHPTLHPNGRHVVTDVYLHESLAFGDGTTPIRWIDLEAGTEQMLVRINNDPPFPGPKKELRIDPHPAWDKDFRWIAFNGCKDGIRRVYVADLSGHVERYG
ncbi:MAG: hypothetical protein O2954_05945, partial [bacterium]|nr:hypothetical protein [bacterium]